MSVEEQLAGAFKAVVDDVKQKFKEFQEQEPLSSVFMGFVHAIDWKEPWVRGLAAVQVFVVLLALFTRKRTTFQTCIFAYAAGIVYMGERLNRLGAKHWRKFSEQNYFDKDGVFFSALVSGPLLLVMFIILVNYLLSCVSLLIKAKKMELKHKAKQRKQQEGAAGGQQGEAAAGSSELKKQK